MRISRRRWWILAACLAAAGLALAGWWLWPSPSGLRFTRDQYDRLRQGMTLAEVESVVGCPPGHYGSQPSSQDRRRHPDATIWEEDGAAIMVTFKAGKVCEIEGRFSRWDLRSIVEFRRFWFELLRRRLGL